MHKFTERRSDSIKGQSRKKYRYSKLGHVIGEKADKLIKINFI